MEKLTPEKYPEAGMSDLLCICLWAFFYASP